jgi:hypothetical protein
MLFKLHLFMRSSNRIVGQMKNLLCVFIAMILTSSLFGKVNDSRLDLAQVDTLQNVSMMFEIKFGEANAIDINNHPVIKNAFEDFNYYSETELPLGLMLSNKGIISWSPTVEQFGNLKEHPYLLDFHANSTGGSYVKGQIRIIALGEMPEQTVVAIDSTETSQTESAPISAEAEVEQPLEPISLVLTKAEGWDTRKEGEKFDLQLEATGGSGEYKFELVEPSFLMENLDQYGNFTWEPGFDFVASDEILKSVPVKIKVFDTEGNEFFETISLFIEHVNRPPVVSELPTFYIQYSKENTYQLKKDGLTFDPDGDSIVFTPVLKELPQGMVVNKNGLIKWNPSRRQVNYLNENPLYLSFTVEDFPYGEKSIGQVRIEVSQADLPPEIAMIPNKQRFEINEDEELNLNFFITDPNGQNDLLSFGFVSENSAIPNESLKNKEEWQYEFRWTPGYNFIKEVGEKNEFDISFYAIDRESNRTERNILVTVVDTENILEKDRVLYDQYRTVLERAFDMISQLNEKEDELEKKYKNAKQGKKKRAISTASLGALTGLSPIIFINNPDGQKIAAGLGGTATATIGTLEASNVIGEPPSDIMRDLNYVSQKRNDLLIYGNVFASKYALPVSKRDNSFQSDLRSLSIHLSVKDGANLDLDAAWENKKDASSRNIKKIFKDFNKDERFEENYK